MAELYVHLGEKGLALDWLEKAYELKIGDLPEDILGARFKNLRAEPRYTEMLKQIKLIQID